MNRNYNLLSKVVTGLKYSVKEKRGLHRFCLTLLFLLAIHFGNAQVAGYSFAPSAGTYTPITGGTVATLSTGTNPGNWDDATSTAANNIGFSFNYNGNLYTQCVISTNGAISFGGTSVEASNYGVIVSNTGYAGAIAAWSRDIQGQNPAPTGEIRYETSGAAGSRVFTVQWSNARRYFSTGTNAERIEMQIKLHETTNVIELVYGTWSNAISATNTTALGQVGLRGSSNSDFKVLEVISSGNWSTPTVGSANNQTVYYNQATVGTKPASGLTYTFTPPPACSVPTDQATSLVFGTPTINTIPATFTAAASAPSGYLVVRYPAGAAVTNPSTSVTYTPGTALGLGTIVSAGATTGFTATGLSPGTNYDFYVYDYNSTACFGGPVYNTTTPLTGTLATTSGTLSGIKTVGTGGDYNNLTSAFAAINTLGLSGNIELQLITGYPATAETYPIATSTASAAGIYTVKVYPTVSGLAITSANATGTLNLNGAGNLTIDGRVNQVGPINLVIANTNVGASYAIQFINDASNNTIVYCSVRSVNNSATSGTIVFGTAAGLLTGNDTNTIDNCEIMDGASTPLNAIYSAGTSTVLDNSGNIITNNNISNYFASSGNSNGVFVASNSASWTISNNKFFQTATRTGTGGNQNRAVNVISASGGNFTVNNNTIGFADAAGTGVTTYTGSAANRFLGIDLTVANTPASNIQGNTISGFSLSSTSGGSAAVPTFGGISVQAGTVNIGTTAGNTIGAATGNGAITISATNAPTISGIYTASTGTVNIQNNNIGSINATGSTAATGLTFNGINTTGSGGIVTVSSNNIGSSSTANSIALGTAATTTATVTFSGVLNSATGTPSNVNSNNVYNITNYSSGTSSTLTGIQEASSTSSITHNMNLNIVRNNTMNSGLFYGIWDNNSAFSATVTVNINTNQVYANTMAGTAASTMYGIRGVSSGYTYNNNIIHDLSITANAAAVNSIIYGIYNLASPTNETINGNQVYNLSVAGATTGTGSIISGIHTNTAGGTRTVSGNTVYDFTFTNSSTGSAILYGIYSFNSSPNIFKNKIYGLTATNGAASVVYGIYIGSGTTVNVYNNLIGGLSAPASSLTAPAPSLTGLYITGGTTVNAYYNTINISGSGGANFGTAAVYVSASPTTVDLRNNIFNNTATPSGTGKTVAYQRASTVLTNYAATSNNNLYNAGTASASNLIYFDGTNSDQTIAAFKTRMSTRDQLSVKETPTFVSTTGSSSNFLHIDTTVPTAIESGAAPIGAVTDDFDGDLRNGTTPDIGADEGAFTVPPVPTISSLGATSGCVGSSLVINGTNLATVSSVTIGGTTAAITNTTATTVTVTVGTGTTGTVNVVSVSGNATSAQTFTILQLPVITAQPVAPPTVCTGSGVATISVTAPSATTFQWRRNGIALTNTGIFSGVDTATLTITNPTLSESGSSYDVIVSDVCSSTSNSVTLLVSPLPSAVSVVPGSSAVCANTITMLTASGGSSASSLASGNGSNTSTAQSTVAALGPNPAQNYYGGAKQQWIYTASELTALGFSAGATINSVKINLPAANTALPLQNFIVKMKNSNVTSYATTSSWETGMTVVRPAASFTPAVGTNTITLTTPFVWNGTGSLVVEMNYTNANAPTAGTNSSTYTNTAFVSTLYYRADSTPTATIDAYVGAASFSYSARTDVTFDIVLPAVTTWTPIANLYTDAAATTAYTLNTPATVVYAKTPTTATYTATATNGAGCTASGSATITVGSTTWDGLVWSNSAPTAVTAAEFTGDYASTGDLSACSLTVTSGNVTVNPGHDFTIKNAVTVSGGSLTFENNANLLQTTNAANTGNIKVKREATMRRLDYVYWGAPVAGQNLKTFSPQTVSPPVGASRFYTMNETNNSFTVIPDPTVVDFALAKGYMLRAPNDFPTNGSQATFFGEFNGVPNNGNAAIAITNTPGTGQGFNMLGNPYPSTVSASLFLTQNPGALYFWAHANQNAASGANYATYTTFGTAAAAGGATPDGSIAVGQGFLLKTAASGTATFTNAMRTGNNSALFFRSENVEKSRIWLNLTNEVGTQNQILVGYMEGATMDADVSIDAKQIEGGISNIASLIGDDKYNIQARALPFINTDEVPLSFNALTAGTFTIAIDHVDGLFAADQDVFIKDNVSGITHNVKQSGYTFAAEAGTTANRFSVVFQDATLGIENPGFDANNVVVFKNNNVLNINSGSVTMSGVKVFDIRGRLIFEQSDINANTAVLTNLRAEQEVLLVQVTSNDNRVVTKKVVY